MALVNDLDRLLMDGVKKLDTAKTVAATLRAVVIVLGVLSTFGLVIMLATAVTSDDPDSGFVVGVLIGYGLSLAAFLLLLLAVASLLEVQALRLEMALYESDLFGDEADDGSPGAS